MSGAFSDILGFFELFGDILMNSIESFIMAITFMVGSIPFVSNLALYMPSIIGASLVIVISIGTVKMLLGR